MDRRYDDFIQTHVEEAYGQGWTTMPWWILYEAHNADRLSKNLWRDLLQRWREINTKKKTNYKLVAYKDHAETVLLVCGDGKKGAQKLPMLFEVSELADDVEQKLGMD